MDRLDQLFKSLVFGQRHIGPRLDPGRLGGPLEFNKRTEMEAKVGDLPLVDVSLWVLSDG